MQVETGGSEPKMVARVRSDETDGEIFREVMRCAELGVFVSYFNSQEELNLYQLRRAVHA